MALTKPSSYIDWTTNTASARIEPSTSKKSSGWLVDEKPAREYMNWLFFQSDQWTRYLESITDSNTASITTNSTSISSNAATITSHSASIATHNNFYTAVVGSVTGCTHATLALALADATVLAGSRILVMSSATVLSTIVVSKANVLIEFAPGVTYTNSTAATGIQISTTGVRIKGGRFSSFTTAISLDAGMNLCFVSECRFSACTTEILDNNTVPNNAFFGNISE